MMAKVPHPSVNLPPQSPPSSSCPYSSNNILYPKENKAQHKLMYACSRCTYVEEVDQGACVYRNNLITTAGNKLDIVQADVIDDPTLQRSKSAICEKCNYNEAVFFQADEVSFCLVLQRKMTRKMTKRERVESVVERWGGETKEGVLLIVDTLAPSSSAPHGVMVLVHEVAIGHVNIFV
ncbi:unnamed protein product [Choristocarpus tenellus]